MKLEEIKNVDIIGAGLMGHGIAQVFGLNGYRVNLFNNDQRMLKSAPNRIQKNLQVFLALDLVEEPDVERCLNNINLCHDMSALCNGLDVIIEAVSETLAVKKSKNQIGSKSIECGRVTIRACDNQVQTPGFVARIQDNQPQRNILPFP